MNLGENVLLDMVEHPKKLEQFLSERIEQKRLLGRSEKQPLVSTDIQI